ncbi:hypothetical protein HHK36_025040 [Tetracentron sinense]|uniref:protein-serine/threonine phosphatase n=1 Tax=Tetracentron sinense TaxID=13715 RepID=A0A835D4N6_TETSI|nr:hypothetical protein HHK36_025040 [Tetracentron sinense]
MPIISGTTDENQKPLDNVFSAQLRYSDLSMLTGTKSTTKPSTLSSTSSTTTVLTHRCSLKRKRPPDLVIPKVLREIDTDEVKFRDIRVEGDADGFDGVGVGVFSVKGKKTFMEDTHKIVPGLQGDPKKGFFGVYDGHGGRKAAEFVAENLHGNILEMLENCKGDMSREDAIKAGYLKTDQEFLKQGLDSGACCVTALIEGKDIVVSNLGDCRAVLCRGGVAEALTNDHRAGREDEREIIEKKGGYVVIHRGVWRVHGVLSVSRSIGDVHLKDWVLAEPDTKILHLTPDMQFLVLASDGLWEKVGNQEAVDTTMRACLAGNKLGATGDFLKENKVEFGCGNMSPLSKSLRNSLVKQQKMMSKSPSQGSNGYKTVDKENEVEFGCGNMSPLSKSLRNSLVKQQKMMSKSPSQGSNGYKTVDKENEDEYACKNTSPPSKSRRISIVSQQKMKTQSPNKESNGYKKRPTCSGLVTACKELVNLAVTRGSLDDVTVMIIDLKHFRCSS